MKFYQGTWLRGESDKHPKMVVDDDGKVIAIDEVERILSLAPDDRANLTFEQACDLTPSFQWNEVS